jgi:hypothetical protein
MVTSSVYGYNRGYYVADSLEPSKGYWVKADSEGKLILTTQPQLGMMAITGSERTGMSRTIRIVASNEFPPPPPGAETNIPDRPPHLPSEFSLEQNYPNPFNPITTLKYNLPVDSKLSLKVYNLLGQVVATLLDGQQAAGYQSITWNGHSFSSGVYLYKLEAVSMANPNRTFTSVNKMLLLR